MRPFPLLIFLLIISNQLFGQVPNTIGPATRLTVRITNVISSEQGSLVSAVVDQPVIAPNGKVLIAANTPVKVQAEKQATRGLGKGGYIKLTPLETYATDQQVILLTGGFEATGKERKGRTWALAAGTFAGAIAGGIIMMVAGFNTDLDDDRGDTMGAAGAGLVILSPFSWLFLLSHGKPALIAENTKMENVFPMYNYTVAP